MTSFTVSSARHELYKIAQDFQALNWAVKEWLPQEASRALVGYVVATYRSPDEVAQNFDHLIEVKKAFTSLGEVVFREVGVSPQNKIERRIFFLEGVFRDDFGSEKPSPRQIMQVIETYFLAAQRCLIEKKPKAVLPEISVELFRNIRAATRAIDQKFMDGSSLKQEVVVAEEGVTTLIYLLRWLRRSCENLPLESRPEPNWERAEKLACTR